MTTQDQIKAIQKSVLVKQDGIVGPKTIQAIYDKVVPEKPAVGDSGAKEGVCGEDVPIGDSGVMFIVNQETGGRKYYDAKLTHPTWPGGESGVTLGIGYDAGYNTYDQIQKDWGDEMSNTLRPIIGLKGAAAKSALATYKGVQAIEVKFSEAICVFEHSTLPRFWKETKKAFPGVEELCPSAITALISLVFNRGASMEGERRAEMRTIKSMVPKKDYKGIAGQLREMKRLWAKVGLDGLLTRREEEAKLVEKCIADV